MHALDGQRYTCGEIVADGAPSQEAVVKMMHQGDFNQDGCTGNIYLRQLGSRMQVNYDLSNCGANEEGSHGFHVHTAADFSNGCLSTGGHFNPTGTQNLPDEVGMLENIIIGSDGNGKGTFVDDRAFLDGEYSIDGLSLVMHSVTGARLTCGAINAQKPSKTAVIKMNPGGNWLDTNGCNGVITMEQFEEPKRNRISYNLNNCGGEGNHGFHVHTTKDFSNGCLSTGGHFNPTGTQVLADEVGMLPSIPVASDGSAVGVFEDEMAFLDGEYSIDNLPLTMHALDGSRQACGFVNVQEKAPMPVKTATVKMNSFGTESNNEQGCSGFIFIYQYEGYTRIDYDLNNCGGEGNHGFHVHEQADFSNQCMSTGGHYNPTGETDVSLEVGMLESIYVDENGRARGSQINKRAFLDGQYAIAGRSLVMHSLSGSRYVCGAIEMNDAPVFHAEANMMATGDYNKDGCEGTIGICQMNGYSIFVYELKNCGASEAGFHGFHVHTAADFSNGCLSTGGHYNPTGTQVLADEVGMLENIKINADGTARGSFMDSRAFLDGQYSIDGLSLVMHALNGSRLTCGEIEIKSSSRRR